MTPWQTLQAHLKLVIEQAIEQKQCPPKWPSFWSETVCTALLERMPLSDWLRVAVIDVAQSRGRYFPAKAAKRVTFWTPHMIERPGLGEDEWEAQMKKQEQVQEQDRIQEQVQEINR